MPFNQKGVNNQSLIGTFKKPYKFRQISFNFDSNIGNFGTFGHVIDIITKF